VIYSTCSGSNVSLVVCW